MKNTKITKGRKKLRNLFSELRNYYAVCANFPKVEILGFEYSSRQVAKTPRFGRFWLLTLRLRVFAGNVPIVLVAAPPR
jgi:hypothetical protein